MMYDSLIRLLILLAPLGVVIFYQTFFYPTETHKYTTVIIKAGILM